MSNNSLGREAHNETSESTLEKKYGDQAYLNLEQHQVTRNRDLEIANRSPNGHTHSLQDDSPLPHKSAILTEGQPDVTYPEGGLQAWLVVLGSFSGMLAAFGLMNVRHLCTSNLRKGTC